MFWTGTGSVLGREKGEGRPESKREEKLGSVDGRVH